MRDGDSYAYVCQKFAVALDEIAAGEGPVKMRLHNAYISSLSHLSEDDLPEELREEFSSIYEVASWLPPEAPEEGMMASTARHMTDNEQAARIALYLPQLHAQKEKLEADLQELEHLALSGWGEAVLMYDTGRCVHKTDAGGPEHSSPCIFTHHTRCCGACSLQKPSSRLSEGYICRIADMNFAEFHFHALG